MLGKILAFAFVHTALQAEKLPDFVNFDRQAKRFDNILKIDIYEIKISKNDRKKGYPYLVESKCEILRIYKGNNKKKSFELTEEKESLSAVLSPTIGQYFYFYNKEDILEGGQYLSEFRLWPFSKELESRVEDGKRDGDTSEK